ncbi:MAG: CaiB/BaiF CoA transferase family protein [Alphaproteobacteria bacterium]
MQPFAGVKVIDMTHVLAGPFCAYQLSVMGADVIKVENPKEGDMVRPSGSVKAFNKEGLGTAFITQNSNKRAITLDIKTAKGQAILKRLWAISDVFIENYRAGALPKLGLGYEDAVKVNPRIIYCSMTGFGQTGPKAGNTAYDNVIQAYSGLMTTTGRPGDKPLKVGPPVLDYGSGIMAAYAISCALFQRTRTGKSQHIDVAMMDAAFMLMSSTVTDYLNGGGAPKLMGNGSDNAGYACYEAKDGMVAIGGWTVNQQNRMWKVLGFAEGKARTLEDIQGAHDEQEKVLAAHFKTLPCDELVVLFHKSGLPAEKVQTLADALASPQAQSRSVIHRHAEIPGLGKNVAVPVAAFTYAHGGPAVHSPPPRHGQHTDDVLSSLGYDAAGIAELRKEGVV